MQEKNNIILKKYWFLLKIYDFLTLHIFIYKINARYV